MKLLRPLLATIAAIALLAWLMPNVRYGNLTTLILAGGVLTLLQKLLQPLLKILFLPINLVTLGFFSVLINVFLLWLATYLVPGFVIEPVVVLGVHLNGFFTLLLISSLIGFTQSLIASIL